MERIKDISNSAKAQVLTDALPYIQKYYNKTIVIKYGGNAMIDEQLKDSVMRDIVLLSLVGIRVVVVHGGGPEISGMLKRVGKESRFVNGLRYTDKETAEIVQMVLAGKVNKDLVSLLSQHGGKAIGLCGIDGKMLVARKADTEEDLGYVGDIVEVNTDIINDTLNCGYIPIISTVATDNEGNVYNVNADTAASKIASALHAKNLILMTDIRGLLRDKDDDSTLIPVVKASEVPSLTKQGIISGGMIPKVDCCVEAVRRGVDRVFIIDGRVQHSALIEIFSNEGIGTMLIG
ncbi:MULTISPECIES: acetylglutamate kinase [Clostridiaceae]|uniref:Acetylglutamate kinase n=1 Tax=Clostridium facile TaxID=2763035 RepID=A0ABR7IMX6_9CLOT|nr:MULTISPECIES: acetylglutamate kinase [Clostridiaceae]MBC5786488.1 acetylglutamate kinase [Clostridium facile]PWN00614.1 MAG: acetylglutamate kinase [Massilioclostridium sp.]